MIEPVQCLFDEFVAWDIVSSFVPPVFLLVFLRSKQLVEQLLARLHRENEIVASIQHQERLLHPWQEINGIDFRKRPPQVDSPSCYDTDLESCFHGRDDTAQFCAPA